jgi:hypothetical protein
MGVTAKILLSTKPVFCYLVAFGHRFTPVENSFFNGTWASSNTGAACRSRGSCRSRRTTTDTQFFTICLHKHELYLIRGTFDEDIKFIRPMLLTYSRKLRRIH